jgi:hypothetical protein
MSWSLASFPLRPSFDPAFFITVETKVFSSPREFVHLPCPFMRVLKSFEARPGLPGARHPAFGTIGPVPQPDPDFVILEAVTTNIRFEFAAVAFKVRVKVILGVFKLLAATLSAAFQLTLFPETVIFVQLDLISAGAALMPVGIVAVRTISGSAEASVAAIVYVTVSPAFAVVGPFIVRASVSLQTPV